MKDVIGAIVVMSIPFVLLGLVAALSAFHEFLFPYRPGAKRPANNG